MTEQNYTQRVFQRISGGKPSSQSPVITSAIQLGLPDALRKIAVDSIETDYRNDFEFDYTLAISGLTAPFTSQTDLLSESIKACNYIKHANVTKQFIIVESVEDLDYEGAVSFTEFAFAAVGSIAVYFRYPAGTLTGNLTVRAVKIPTLLTLRTQHDKRLIDAGVMLALAKLEQMQATT